MQEQRVSDLIRWIMGIKGGLMVTGPLKSHLQVTDLMYNNNQMKVDN